MKISTEFSSYKQYFKYLALNTQKCKIKQVSEQEDHYSQQYTLCDLNLNDKKISGGWQPGFHGFAHHLSIWARLIQAQLCFNPLQKFLSEFTVTEQPDIPFMFNPQFNGE